MTTAEYKEKFGLCNKAKTTEANYSALMHDLAYKYDMPKRLQEAGKTTRFKRGEKIRLGKKVRLQECIDKSARYKKEVHLNV